MKIILLSHPLNTKTPLYPGTPEPEFSGFKSIKKGDSANSSNASFNVHTGTHIDLPLHFCDGGASLSQYIGPEYLLYPAYCINVEKKGDAPLLPEDLAGLKEKYRDAEGILIRTGAGAFRGRNDQYEHDHPWIHPSLPEYLKNAFPQLKLFGLDTISISSPNHREEGKESHRRFLCGEKPVLLLEDADLSEITEGEEPFRLRIYPYFHENLDASPVIALAEFDHGSR